MELRATTIDDLQFVAEHSISRGAKDVPLQTDFPYTIEHEGEVMCTGGFRLINMSTAWCHVNLTDCSGGHIVHLYRIIRDWITSFTEENNIRRLQCYVECDFEEGIRLVEHLGFHKESIMPNFAGDDPAFMYSRITNGTTV
jgi:hypothetical protein